MTEIINADISYIEEIQASMSQDKGAWYKMNWYLLHHKDIDLRTAYSLYKKGDESYNRWLEKNEITNSNKDDTIEKILLSYINDFITTIKDEDETDLDKYINREKER